MDKQKISLEEQFNDYEKTPVPVEARRNWYEQGMIWLGEGFGLSGLATGGVLADGLSFADTFLAAVIGSILVSLICALVAVVSTNTHLSTSVTCRRSFGTNGSRVIGVILAASLFGWFAYNAGMFGETISSLLKSLWSLSVPAAICTAIGGMLMSLTAIFGVKAIKSLSTIGLPLLFVLCILAVWKINAITPLTEIAKCGPVATPMSLSAGVAYVVSGFAVGMTMCGDFSRFSKSKRDSVVGSFLGHCFGFIPVVMCGAICNYAMKTWNVVEVMVLSLGMGLFGTFVLVVAQWTTNDNSLYMSTLGLMNSLDGVVKIPRMRMTLLVGIISTIVGICGIYNYFINFLNVLGILIAPLSGIIIADYFICYRSKYDESPDTVDRGVRWNAIVAWFVASLVGMIMTQRPIGFGLFVSMGDIIPLPIVTIVVALAVYTVGEKLAKPIKVA